MLNITNFIIDPPISPHYIKQWFTAPHLLTAIEEIESKCTDAYGAFDLHVS
jgi:hypothetical protein